jgi:hypothetical protein
MNKRDPRVDPAFLDVVVLCKGIKGRQVQLVTVLGTVVYLTCRVPSPGKVTFYGSRERQCSLETWRRWCKGGSVEAKGPQPGQAIPVNTLLDRSEINELNAFRNAMSRELAGRYRSDTHTTSALVRLAIAVLKHHKAYDMPFELSDLMRVIDEGSEESL